VELARLQVIEVGDAHASLAAIDKALTITPPEQLHDLKVRLWMEGLACFYTCQWERGAAHFVAEMAVNGSDVEVPVWRWLCDAYNPKYGPAGARERLMPLHGSGDPRIPMAEIYALYKGTGTIDEVMRAALQGGDPDTLMWAHFYVGLYLEALGQLKESRHYLEAAANTESRNNISMLARTHWRITLQREAAIESRELGVVAAEE
jgi:hypothetical protein